MKEILFFISISFLSFSGISQVRYEKTIQRQDKLLLSGYNFRTPLSGHINLTTGVFIANYGAFNQLELPVLFKYNITDKWGVKIGSELSTITNSTTNLLEPMTTGFTNVNLSMYFGTFYKFSETTEGELSLKYSIINNQNTSAITSQINTPLRFNLGLRL